jgi:hypothetical protein
MSIVCEVMTQAGLLDEQVEAPDLSAVWPPRGIDQDRAEWIAEALSDEEAQIDPPLSQRELTLVRTAQEEMDKLLASRSPAIGRVPAYKFASNDGWIVTSQECELISKALTPPLDLRTDGMTDKQKEVLQIISEWSRFNAAAALNGGYRVL